MVLLVSLLSYMKTSRTYILSLLVLLTFSLILNAQDTHSFSFSGPESENYTVPFAGGMNACQFGEIDLDRDGIKDLIAFDRHGNRLIPYINGGTAGSIDYSYTPEYVDKFPDLEHWMILKDYNMDGKNDIFTYNTQFPGIIVYKNTSQEELRFERVVYPYLTSWYGSIYINILVTYADYPGIEDIDGDGDLDIITFWTLFPFVELHTNLSMETYGHADSLIFEKTNSCWGYFAENEESNELFLDTCFGSSDVLTPLSGRDRHTGSTMLLTNLTNDGVVDLLLGDVDYPELIYLNNVGTQEEARIESYSSDFPDSEKPSWIYSMPVAALIDVNNDDIKDLLVSPFDPNPFISQNKSSVWLYLNEGSNASPYFSQKSKSFLQDQMIDLGSGAYPAFADINLDGLQDMIIGNWGYYQSSWYDEYMILYSDYNSSMMIFMNVGDADKAQFEYITDDFGSIREMMIKGASPCFGDIDTDDDADMIVGRDDGTLMFYRNCSCLGNPEDFELEMENYMGIDVGDYSTPFLWDLDEDGLIDLLIGEKKGNINYYRNTGSIHEPIFSFVTDSLGKINVTDPGLSWNGYSTPYMFRASDGTMRLVSGSEQGEIFYYTNIEGNLDGAFDLSDELWVEIDSVEFTVGNGYRTAAAIADLNNDGYLDMAVGNWSGGLNLYSTGIEPPVSMDINESWIASDRLLELYPNPVVSELNIKVIPLEQCDENIIRVYSITGSLMLEQNIFDQSQVKFEVGHLPLGIYICTLSDKRGQILARRKFIRMSLLR